MDDRGRPSLQRGDRQVASVLNDGLTSRRSRRAARRQHAESRKRKAPPAAERQVVSPTRQSMGCVYRAASMTAVILAVICAAGLSQSGVAAGVYAELLGESYHAVPASRMVVKDTAAAMPRLRGSSSEWLKKFEGVPLQLRQRASQPSPTQPRRLDASMFPPQTRLVPAAAIESIFTNSGVEENWSAFRTQFKAQGWVAFSDVLVASDQLNALVYYESRCGGLCGEGGYVWLRRDAPGSRWRISKKIVSWMS